MRSGQTNVGKKEQRQINQVLTKAKDRIGEKRLSAKQHRTKGQTKS